MEHTSAKIFVVVYLKFKCGLTPFISPGSSQEMQGEGRLTRPVRVGESF